MRLPLEEIEFTFARGAGPGGQNVNKVSSKARLRWNVVASQWLPDPVKRRFCRLFENRITKEGDLVLASDRFRDQLRNREDCLERLERMIREAASPPKKRRPTKPTRSSQSKRLESKKRHSWKKRERTGGWD